MSILRTFAPLMALVLAADDPPEKKLTMSDAIACSKITGYGDYVKLDEAVLTRDDKLLLYYEPSGYSYQTVGKEYRVHFVQDAKLRRRGQKAVIQSKDKLLDYKGNSKEPPLSIYLSNTISLKALSPGEYDLELILHDEVGKTPAASQVVKFRVKAVEEAEKAKESKKDGS